MPAGIGAEEGIVAAIAEDAVIYGTAVETVGLRAAFEQIIARLSVKVIVAGSPWSASFPASPER